MICYNKIIKKRVKIVDIQTTAFVIFVAVVTLLLFLKRKNIVIQKILHPLFYIILYRTGFGLKLMDKLSSKYKQAIRFFGLCSIGLAVIGMIFVSASMLFSIFNLFKAPPAETGVALVLPFTNIPGIGYLSFIHWIIAIFILAVIHEFCHGLVARANGIGVKSSGFAFFSVFVPLIPAAFVEPDENKLKKASDVVQYSIFSAGPIANIVLALILLFAFPYAADFSRLAPFEEKITEPVGFSFELTNSSMPAATAGLDNGMIIDSFNNKSITDSNEFLTTMFYCAKPGETISLGADGKSYSITTIDSNGKGIIGVKNIKNERRVKTEYKLLSPLFYWLKDLIRWIFLLNFFVGLFNLLPLGIVDGGRILNTFLESMIKDKDKAKRIWAMVSFVFILIILFSLFSTYFGKLFFP